MLIICIMTTSRRSFVNRQMQTSESGTTASCCLSNHWNFIFIWLKIQEKVRGGYGKLRIYFDGSSLEKVFPLFSKCMFNFVFVYIHCFSSCTGNIFSAHVACTSTSWTNWSHMVHSEVLCPDLMSLFLRGWYVYLLESRNEPSRRGQAQTNTTEYTTAPLGVNTDVLSCPSLACSNCIECVSTHHSHSRGSVQCTWRQC